MKRLLLLLCFAASAFAQNSISFTLLQPRFSGVSANSDGEAIPVGLRSKTGLGFEAAHRIGRVSLGMSASRMTAPASTVSGLDRMSVGSLALTPITADVAFHGNGGRVDPFIGAGLAYVMTGNLRSANLDSIGLGTVAVGNDFTYNVKAGVGFVVAPRVALQVGARYMPVSVRASAANAGAARLRFNTLTYGIGISWSF